MRRRSWRTALLLVLSLMLVACRSQPNGTDSKNPGSPDADPQPSAGQPKAGGTLTIGTATEPANLDPGRDPGGPEQNVLYAVVETLVSFDEKMQVVPTLAKALPEVSADGLTYTVQLRDGVKFHDGEPLTAEAVKFTFDRVQGKVGGKPGAYQNLVSGLDNTETVDQLTVRFHLKKPSATFLTNISHLQFGIVSPKAVQSAGEQFARQPVGTGPFKVASWEQGQQITLVKNASYWNAGLPRLDKVVFKKLPDASTRLIALESGQIDVMLELPENEVSRLKENKQLQLFSEPTLRTVFYLFSPSQFPFDDRAVREAFTLAVDREGIASGVLEGMHKAATRATFNPTVWGVTDKVPAFEYNSDKAKQVLDQAGWKAGSDGIRTKNGKSLKFTLWTTSNRYPKDKLVSEFVGQSLKKIGMAVDVQTMEWAAYREKLYKKEMPAFLFGAGSSTGDIDFIASALFNPSSQFAQYSPPDVVKLITGAQTELNLDARKRLYDDAFTKLYDERLWVPVYWQSTLAAARPNVKEFRIHPTERIVVNSAWKQ